MSGRLPTVDSNIDVELNCAWTDVTIYLGYICNAVAGFALLVSLVSFSEKPMRCLMIIKVLCGVLAEIGLAGTLGFMIQNVIEGSKSVFLYYEKPIISMKTNQDYYVLNICCVFLEMLLIYVINNGIYQEYKEKKSKQRRSKRKTSDEVYELGGSLNTQDRTSPFLDL